MLRAPFSSEFDPSDEADTGSDYLRDSFGDFDKCSKGTYGKSN
jgi:hypothetical protein